MSLRLVLLALLLVATPAMAFDTTKLGQGGTLPLGDIMPLIGKAPQLKREVGEMLAQANKKPEDVICSGYRFPGAWVNLGGERVSPYTCDFGIKWLQIKATVRIIGRSRQVYDTITPAAMMNATRVSEIDPTWAWTAAEPSE
ncbi:MAG: hypothetical protein QOI12_4675 [Alphaproteobacteria bacterium]|jgi:hypothetical protein|nr:hypothetical protein [Alphaproteobacteria bacterium]